eukprot:CAMPEP_0115098136 /NCGR_PEP_ID=MMETSP0227-20121206/30951_1 /TAXON_ID=89957 /ORGANISM="Polarella glacialis, Strain CCMP 1383" /LENGTH=450 /DNA_ID=CAMNT_0002492627 /DNA_START=124 /DNA_END=1476 /DNA_ORIENTATION=+
MRISAPWTLVRAAISKATTDGVSVELSIQSRAFAHGFESPIIGQHTRGRDPAPRAQALPRENRGRPSKEDDFQAPAEVEMQQSLGQLASVFEVVARLDSGGELRRLSNEVLEERRQLERQLAKRRELEQQLRQSRNGIDEVREERRRLDVESAATKCRVAHLQDELVFVGREIQGCEEDLDLLRQAAGLGKVDNRRGPAPYSNPEEERRDVLSKVRAERELLLKDQRAIEEHRTRLDQIFRQKQESQTLQQALLEKQRQSEQDRGLMLTAIEADRGKFGAMREKRLRLWEDRSELEREMQDLSQEQWLSHNQASPGIRSGPTQGSQRSDLSGRESRARGVLQEETPHVIYGGSLQSPPPSQHLSAAPGSDRSAGPSRPWVQMGATSERFADSGQRGGAIAGGYAVGGATARPRDGRGVRADDSGARENDAAPGGGGGWRSDFGAGLSRFA